MEATNPHLAQAILALYYLVFGILAFYGVHRLVLVAGYYRTRGDTPLPPPAPREWPVVTVQLPLFNEMYVAQRLIDAVCRLEYPRDKLEIQVLDDSTDETTALVAALVAEYRERGFDIHLRHREDRRGYKAGALAAGLAGARGELVAIFDADFVPRPDFLRASVPYFADPEIGMVQARWDYINRDYSLLTRVQAIFLDGHFLLEHTVRHRTGCFFNFNGTAGVWRRRAIEEAGGWQHDTLTEDLDLSYRAQLAGWKFLYLPDLVVPSELPVDIAGFKSQQRRWAKGAVQTGRKLLGRILAAPLPWRVKLEAFIHLTNNSAYLLMILLSLLVFPAMMIRLGSARLTLLLVDLPLFLAATVSVVVYYVVSQVAAGRRGWQLRSIVSLMGLGIGLSLNNALAVVAGLVERGGVFHRTPKYSIESRRQGWRDKRYRAAGGRMVVLEGLFALYFAACALYAAHVGVWLSLPFLYLFLQGYTYMFLLSLRQAGPRLSAGG